jgi:hypothetical protein
MDTGLIVVIVALATGFASGYITLASVKKAFGLKGVNPVVYARGPSGDVLTTFNILAIVAGIIWAFLNLTWWWVVLAIVGLYFVVPVVIQVLFGGIERVVLMRRVQPLLEIICIIAASYLWIAKR